MPLRRSPLAATALLCVLLRKNWFLRLARDFFRPAASYKIVVCAVGKIGSGSALPTLPPTPPEATEPSPANARHGCALTPATAPDAAQAAPKDGLRLMDRASVDPFISARRACESSLLCRDVPTVSPRRGAFPCCPLD